MRRLDGNCTTDVLWFSFPTVRKMDDKKNDTKGNADMKKLQPFDVAEIMARYYAQKPTIKELAEMYGISAGKTYYILRDAGCKFSRKRRKPMPQEMRDAIGRAHKGEKLSEEQRRQISERNSCNYNGLNGYGHTKRHNRGYILAYAPKHPHAHADGYVMLHTVIMERAIGRYLKDNEVVHHKNHDRTDNRLENLELMDKHEHSSKHMKERWNDLLTV